MPRDLSDVLHYFLPELDGAPDSPTDIGRPFASRIHPSSGASPRRRNPPTRRETSRLPLSILGVPIGERDIVHAAYTWNLAAETARLGGSSAILTPEVDRAAPLWPASGSGRLDIEIVYSPARNLAELRKAAVELAAERGKTARRGGVVFTRIPPAWLDASNTSNTSNTSNAPVATPANQDGGEADWIRWLLVFTSARRRDVEMTFERVRRWVHERPGVEVGVTIHGVNRIDEARRAFDDLARACEERLGLSLASYGLLVDDLDLYRAIAAGRPIGRENPNAPAARALTDVARLLYEDARSRLLG